MATTILSPNGLTDLEADAGNSGVITTNGQAVDGENILFDYIPYRKLVQYTFDEEL